MVSRRASHQDRFVYILTYLFSFISGLVVYVTLGQSDKRLKVHAAQAIVLGLAGLIIAALLVFLPPLGSLIELLIWIYGLYIGYSASEGSDIRIPFVTDWLHGLL
jgi:uncharacterized membrane protein